MLAGKIKLRTFAVLVGTAIAVLLLTLWAMGGKAPQRGGGTLPPARKTAVAKQEQPPALPPAPAAAAPPSASVEPASGLDRDVLSFVGRNIGTDKVKDAVRGRSYKINVYQDKGETSVNRIKVDLDRDDRWDQKYTLQPGKIERQIAPRDDEEYTQKTTWNGSHWGDGAAAPVQAAAVPAPLRTADSVVLGYRGKNIGTDKLKDVTRGQPFKINIYQDTGKAVASRAKLDLDRDDKWDEKFEFAGESVERQVAPGDDEVYTETYDWADGAWVRR